MLKSNLYSLTMIPRTKACIALLSILVMGNFSCSKKPDSQPNDLPNTDQYFTWNLNGTKGALLSPSDSLASARYSTDTHLAGTSTTNQDGLEIIFQGDRTPGTFTSTYAETYLNNKHR